MTKEQKILDLDRELGWLKLRRKWIDEEQTRLEAELALLRNDV